VEVQAIYDRADAERPQAGVGTLQPRDQFVHYHQHAHGVAPPQDLVGAFDRVYEEVAEGGG
jgi:hypothetical protein